MVLRLVLTLGLLALLAPAPAGAQAVLYEEAIGECTVRLESQPRWNTLSLRTRHPQLRPCPLDREQTLGFLARAAEHIPAEGEYRSLFLGRIVYLPWLGELLAKHAYDDPAWLRDDGRPKQGGENVYVNSVLSKPAVLAPFDEALAPAGLSVRAASVEKVLISAAERRDPYTPTWVPPRARLPYDAMTHLKLQPR